MSPPIFAKESRCYWNISKKNKSIYAESKTGLQINSCRKGDKKVEYHKPRTD